MDDSERNTWVYRPAGDRTIVLEFGESIRRDVVDQVVTLDSRLHAAIEAGILTNVIETIPTFRSLALIFDPLRTTPDVLLAQIRKIVDTSSGPVSEAEARLWQIPVRYGGDAGPDLHSVARLTGLDEERVVTLHQQAHFKVYMLGFLPGFAFLGDTPAELHLPRRSEPRLRVPSGSVAIANQLTGIYPWDSPGGWHILGNCPVPLFDGTQNPPALFKAGDSVSFRSIELDEFRTISASVTDRSFTRDSLLQTQDR